LKFSEGHQIQIYSIGFIKGNGSTTEINYYSFSDLIEASDNYFLQIEQIDFDGSFEYSNEVMIEYSEMNFNLHQNFLTLSQQNYF
jgi:hypothetical protein